MLSSLLLSSFVALAAAIPINEKRTDPSPTLFTFTYLGSPVTATWYGTAVQENAACPTQTFTYEGVPITIPYTGPGTPQSCLDVAPCPTQTFTLNGVGITIPYTGPGTPQSCLSPAGAPPAPAPTPAPTAPAPASSQCSASTGAASAPASPASSPAQVPAPSSSAAPAPAPSSSAVQAPAPAPAPTSSVVSVPVSSPAPASPIIKGFNYGSGGQTAQSFETNFNIAQNLVGTSGFSSARLFTTIQDGTVNDPISAIEAAIKTKTTLLLGLFYPNIDNELAALSRAITTYGSAFADLVVGISVGSEDLYRNSPTGIAAMSNPGANPTDIVNFIQATRNVIAGTILASKPVGHVDTWTAYVNGSNNAVIAACDFIGMDAYPYYQNTQYNPVSEGLNLFSAAYQATVAVAQGKPVWITETGWPVSGKTEANAVPGVSEAGAYWKSVGCGFAFNKINTWWYLENDNGANPSFGVTTGGTTPLYDLSC